MMWDLPPEHQKLVDDALAVILMFIEQYPELARQIAIVLAVAVFLIFLLHILFSWMLYACLMSVPAHHRKAQPYMAWLILIPIANYVLNFFLICARSRSYNFDFLFKRRIIQPQI